MHKRILLATDLSEESKGAFAHAIELARRDSAELHVVFVQVLHVDAAVLADKSRTDLNTAGEAWARETLDRLEFPQDLTVFLHLQRGISAAPVIIGYAAEHRIDLIVVGTHGRTGIARWFLGSVSQEIVRASPVPVLVVGATHPAPSAAPQRILAPVDFSDGSLASLKAAAAIATRSGGQLLALHAIDLSRLPPYYTMELEAERRRKVERELSDWLRKATAPPDSLAIVCDGKADEKIVEVARNHQVDVILMAVAGHGVLDRLLVGSVTERVLRSAPCPVLAYRKPRHSGPNKNLSRAA